MKNTKLLKYVLLLLLFVTVPIHANPDFTELEKIVPEELKDSITPGAVIAIISGDRVIYQKAFGVANVETGAPMQPEMLFRLGSTTKMFTAAALVTLSEQNKINLNEPIANRVKGLNAKVGAVTPHHLLSNSAGIRDFAATIVSNDDAALGNMVRSWKDEIFFTGQGDIYSYSSAGFWLSGFVVEELQGKPYGDAMTELLFKPIGMERTTLRPLMAMTYPMASPHYPSQDGQALIVRPFFNNVAMWPAGSIFSNTKDLSRWVIALMNDGRVDGKQVLSPTLIAKMFGHHIPVPGEKDQYYAYGLQVGNFKGMEFVFHGGFSRGYGSMIQMAPSKKFAVIVLTNRSGSTLRKSIAKAMELGIGLKSDEPEKPRVAPLTTAEMEQYVGSYSHAPETWDVSIKDGKLYVRVEGKEQQMTKSGERKFTFGEKNEEELVFVPGKSGKIEFIFMGLYSAKRVL